MDRRDFIKYSAGLLAFPLTGCKDEQPVQKYAYSSPMVFINDGRAYFMHNPSDIKDIGKATSIEFLDSPSRIKMVNREDVRYLDIVTNESIFSTQTKMEKARELAKASLDKFVGDYQGFDVGPDRIVVFTRSTETFPKAREDSIGDSGVYTHKIGDDSYKPIFTEKLYPWKQEGGRLKHEPVKYFWGIKFSPDYKRILYSRLASVGRDLMYDVGVLNPDEGTNLHVFSDARMSFSLDWVDNDHIAIDFMMSTARLQMVKDGVTSEVELSYNALDPSILPRDRFSEILDADKIHILNLKTQNYDVLDGHGIKVFRETPQF